MLEDRISCAYFKAHLTGTRIILFVALFLSLLCTGKTMAQATSPSSRPTNNQTTTVPEAFKLGYTGALFGYFRIEPTSPSADLVPVAEFLSKDSEGKDHTGKDHLLVGMGDNFGPEFGASIQMNIAPRNRCYVEPQKLPIDENLPEDLYKDSRRVLGETWVDCDNVARFLMKAGYRAVVPGREDFLYSATWLRGIALGLRWANEQRAGELNRTNKQPFPIENPEAQLTMLAANLRVTKPGGAACPLLFAAKLTKKHAGSITTCTAGLNQVTTAMDWLSRVDSSLDPNTGVEEKISTETNLSTSTTGTVHEPSTLELRRTLIENQARQMLSMMAGIGDKDPKAEPRAMENIRSALSVLGTDKAYILNLLPRSQRLELTSSGGSQQNELGVKAFDQLNSNLQTLGCDNQLIVASMGSAMKDLCLFGEELADDLKQVSTKDSLLLGDSARRAGRRLLLRAIALEQKEAGYTISHRDEPTATGTRKLETLIVGVLGQDTMKAVSPTNLAVRQPGNKQEPDSLSDNEQDTMLGSVIALDPLRTLLAVLRGAMQMAKDAEEICTGRPSCNNDYEFDRILVMAQMPRTLAEDLSAQMRVSLRDANQSVEDGTIVNVRTVPILVISEAQLDYYSPDFQVNYTNGRIIPVLTPDPPYDRDGSIWAPDSEADFIFASHLEDNAQSIEATLHNEQQIRKSVDQSGRQSTQYLLVQSLRDSNANPPASCLKLQPISAHADASELRQYLSEVECKRDLNARLLGALRTGQGRAVRGDVVLLEQRDIWYDNLAKGYNGYEVCPYSKQEPDLDKRTIYFRCQLRVALDRVFWKGDYTERVMIAGSDLVSMLTTSQQQELADSSLAPTDVTGQSLATFGIVQPASPNLSRPGSGNEEFPILQDNVCGHAASSITDPSKYCVNGLPISSDGAYWAITSDHLANDSLVYKVMQATKKDSYHETEKEFLTGAIEASLLGPSHAGTAQPEAKTAEWNQQLRDIVHLDIGKVVAGFSAREPDGGNVYAEGFQGAADSRASTPSQQELDLESLARFSWDLPTQSNSGWLGNEPLTISPGIQIDTEYDRAANGNLTNKPTTVVYALNSLTVGPFVQYRLPDWRGPQGTWPLDAGRELPRALLVLSPVQYQEQFTGNYLIFPYSQTPPPTTPPTISGQFTAHAPKVTTLFEKAGLRREFAGQWIKLDTGSYVEAGFEFGIEDNILSSVALTSDGVTPPPCTARSSTTIAACFAGYANPKSATYVKGFQIDNTTMLAVPLTTETLHASGGYWDIHLQRAFLKPGGGSGTKLGIKSGINFTLDSKSDWFSQRGAEKSLNTQTRYDVPLSIALNFPLLRNLSLSPTYSSFFYSTQVTGQSIVINSFSIAAKWYFARDATVPPRRQLYFTGPSSADQTSSAKVK